MSKGSTEQEMTEREKSKDTFSIHQDNLVWSRTQTLIAIQGGVLAGAYAVQCSLLLAVPLLLLGIALTVILWIIVERDQDHRDRAFHLSGLRPTRPPAWITGRHLIRVALSLMLFADEYLLIWLVSKEICTVLLWLVVLLAADALGIALFYKPGLVKDWLLPSDPPPT